MSEPLYSVFTCRGETVLTPFMGVGSEVYGAVTNGRRGIGIELKPTYYRQAVTNIATANTKDIEVQESFGFQEDLLEGATP